MASDGKIYITISDRRGQGGGDTPTPGVPDEKQEEKKENTLESWIAHQGLNLLKQQVVNNLNFAINNIGNFTGNYQLQREQQRELAIFNKIIGVGLTVYAGAKVGGVPGVLIALGVQAVNETVNFVQQYMLNEVQQKQTNHNIEQLRQRSGLNTLRDGSRGTLD